MITVVLTLPIFIVVELHVLQLRITFGVEVSTSECIHMGSLHALGYKRWYSSELESKFTRGTISPNVTTETSSDVDTMYSTRDYKNNTEMLPTPVC